MSNNLLHYGLQRSGTNYTGALISENFSGIYFRNQAIRSLPTHKHFRLHGRMEFVPEPKYLHDFRYPDFRTFDAHVERITGIDDMVYLLVTKDPLTWYLSYLKEAKKNSWSSYTAKGFKAHYITDYSLYCEKWLSFRKEAPGRIYHLRYEDLLSDFEGALGKLGDHFKWKRSHAEFRNLSKVYKSRRFTASRRSHYRDPDLKSAFSPEELLAAAEHLSNHVLEGLGYRLPDWETLINRLTKQPWPFRGPRSSRPPLTFPKAVVLPPHHTPFHPCACG